MSETYALQKLALMPWLSLRDDIKTAEITFRPIFPKGTLHPLLQAVESKLRSMLGFFPDCEWGHGGVFVTTSDDWSVPEERLPDLAVAAGRLYLAAFACQNYFSAAGQYVNTAAFDFYGARLTGVVSFDLRSRVGRYGLMGVTSDMVQFRKPPQIGICRGFNRLEFQPAFLDALGKIPEEHSIAGALSFFLLATRDEQSLDPEREIIMMAAAYEALLGQHTALKVALAVKHLMTDWAASSTVETLRTSGRQVRPCDKAEHDSELAASAAHVGWAYEFYQERNGAIHGNKKQAGAWKQWEHLIMSGYLFPLLVKLKMVSHGLYVLDHQDKQRLSSIDELLAEPDWIGQPNSESPWQRIHSGNLMAGFNWEVGSDPAVGG